MRQLVRLHLSGWSIINGALFWPSDAVTKICIVLREYTLKVDPGVRVGMVDCCS